MRWYRAAVFCVMGILGAAATARAAEAGDCSPGQAARQGDPAALFQAFATQLLARKDARGAYETFAAADMVQRNSPFGATRDSTIAQWEKMTGLPDSRFVIETVVMDGDVGVIHFRGQLKAGEAGAVITQHDRLRCGKIVEEWAEFSAGAK
ncbi:nuclear transport factor 2 family protein [Nitrospirillum sp. BR 11164]|uniref:nuclear transport factor 2 family protein n=1 Tax=Nitrospirillum sp. BR 11164 TaxID=3104324 RepID=UPI002AFFA263|nr:nuclear transport factor 2 family protein [Nitrospirillum sp. BR 11164]MEA1651174.1 nuclear transport factor 2 family protein [Nitrospirillum sp. BR 11164]